MDIRLALIAGTDIPIPEMQLTMHQPRIREIALMGEADFFSAAQYICLQKEYLIQDESLLATMNNFQVLMKVMEQQQTSDRKSALLTLLSLLFPDYSPFMTPNSILLRNIQSGQTNMIDANNFEILQNVIREVLCISSMFQGENVVYNPANAAAKRIVDKIMAGRRKVAEINSKKQGGSVLSRYISILTVGVDSMSLEDNLSLTIFQLFDLMQRYSAWLDWDIDLRQRLAGGNPKSEVENWMRDLYSKEDAAFTTKNTSDLVQIYNK